MSLTLHRNPSATQAAKNLILARNAQRDYGASGSNETTTGTIATGTQTLTLADAKDFTPGQGIFLQHAGPTSGCDPVTGLSATVTGTAGSTTIEYAVLSLDGLGGTSKAATVTLTTAPDTLSTTNYVTVAWTDPTGGTTPTGYIVLAKVGTGAWRYANWNDTTDITSWADQGLYYALPSYLPSTPPTAPTAQWLTTTLTNLAGTTATLKDAASTAMTDGFVGHDDTAALNNFLDDLASEYQDGVIPPGDYWVSGQGALLTGSTGLAVTIWGYGARIHALPGTHACGLAVIDSDNVRVAGLYLDGNMANVDSSGGQYTSACPILVGSFAEGTGGCTGVTLADIEATAGYFGGIVFNTTTRIDVRDPYSHDNRDNAIFGRPHNVDVRVINPRATGSLYNGIEFIRNDTVMVTDVESWDNGPSPYSSEGTQLGFEGCTNFSVNGARLYQSATGKASQGLKLDYTEEGGAAQRSEHGEIRNVVIQNIVEKTLSNGLVIQGYGILLERSSDLTFENVRADGCYRGLMVNNDASYALSDVRFKALVVTNSVDDGADIEATNGSGEALFADCEFSGNGTANNNGCYLNAWDDFTFLDCRFVANEGEGLQISGGTNHKIAGGLVKDNTDNGILVSSDTGTVAVHGMVGTNTTSGSGQARLLYESASGSTVSITDCVIDGQADAPYYLANSGSYATRNTGGPPMGWGTTTPSLPAATGDTVTNSNAYPVRIYQDGASGTTITDYGGTAKALAVDPNELTLEPGAKISYSTTVPSAWDWYGA